MMKTLLRIQAIRRISPSVNLSGALKRYSIALVAPILFSGLAAGQSKPPASEPPPTLKGYSESRAYSSKKEPEQAGGSKKKLGFIDASADTIQIDSTLVTIPVTVSNRSGTKYVSDLVRSEFRIFEEGVQQEIAYFGVAKLPLTVVLLLDTSPSTEYRIEEIQNAALSFVNQLNLEDRVEVIKFNEKIRVLAKATSKREKIFKAIRKARFDGGTSLYDAVDFVLRDRLAKIKGRKAIVLFTDGVDTTSEDAFYDETVRLAEESDTIVFPIFYDTYERMARKRKGRPSSILGKRKLGTMYLNELAKLSGGRVVEPERIPGGLDSAFRAIADELKHQYNIGYYPETIGTPGERRRIRIRVARPDLSIRARDHYIVRQKGNSSK